MFGKFNFKFQNEQQLTYFMELIKGKTLKIPGGLFTVLVCIVSFCVLTIVFALMTRLLPYFFMIMFGIMMYRFVRNMFR